METAATDLAILLQQHPTHPVLTTRPLMTRNEITSLNKKYKYHSNEPGLDTQKDENPASIVQTTLIHDVLITITPQTIELKSW